MDLKFAVSIIGYDHLSGVLGRAADGLMDFGNRAADFGDKVSEAGESMREFGENISWGMFLIQEGADKVKELGDSLLEPAISMDQAMADVAAHTNLTKAGLEGVRKAAVDFSNTHAGATAEQMLENFLRFNAILPDTKSATDAAGESAMLAKFVHIDLGEANDLLITSYANLHEPIGKTGDMLAKTVKYFKMSTDAAEGTARMVGRLSGDLNLTGGTPSEMMAIGGEASLLIPGSRGQIMFASGISEMLEHAGKSGIDTTHGLLSVLEQAEGRLKGTSGAGQAEVMKSLGISNPVMVQLLANLGDIKKANQAIIDSNGMLAAGYTAMTDNAADLLTLQKQVNENAKDAAASGAIAGQKARTEEEIKLAQKVGDTMEHHAKASGMLTTAIHLTGTALTGAVSGLQGVASMIVLGSYGLKALGFSSKLLDVEAMSLRGMYAWDAVKAAGGRVGSLFGGGAGAEAAVAGGEAAAEGGAAAVGGAGALGTLGPIGIMIAAKEYLDRHPQTRKRNWMRGWAGKAPGDCSPRSCI